MLGIRVCHVIDVAHAGRHEAAARQRKEAAMGTPQGGSTTAEVYDRAGFGRRVERGSRPAVVVVDFTYGFTDPQYPTSADMSAAWRPRPGCSPERAPRASRSVHDD